MSSNSLPHVIVTKVETIASTYNIRTIIPEDEQRYVNPDFEQTEIGSRSHWFVTLKPSSYTLLKIINSFVQLAMLSKMTCEQNQHMKLFSHIFFRFSYSLFYLWQSDWINQAESTIMIKHNLHKKLKIICENLFSSTNFGAWNMITIVLTYP